MVVLALLLSACTISVDRPEVKNTISVNGMAEITQSPDEATVLLHVETEGRDPKEAQDKNSAIMVTIKEELKGGAGVSEDEMETINYNLYPKTRWDPETHKQVQDGYRVTHTLKARTTELERVGYMIKLGVDAGATRVDQVSFSLSSDAEQEAKKEALRQATRDARQKAEALAEGLEVRLGKIVSVNINEYNVMPYYRAFAAEEIALAKSVSPPISTKDVDMRASVSVVFEIQQKT